MVGERLGDLGLGILLSVDLRGESRRIGKPTEQARRSHHPVIVDSDPTDQG